VITCIQCGQENPERNKFCGECAAPLGAPPKPAREVRKTVTVVFCDIAGSTAKADGADPEVVRAVLARYYEQMRAVLERHGGTVEKFIGDAVMAVFGVPVAREDDALRAVRAAADMCDELVAAGITARIGVNTGEVVAAPGESLVTGDAVNVAARLEQAAPVGGVLIGDATLALVRDAARVEPVEPLAAKGKRDPLIAWRLVDLSVGGLGVARRLDVGLVGRARERRLLFDAYVRAREERRCVLFTVLGTPGVGKSRLVAELVGEVAGEAHVLSGSCLSYGEGITYWPIAEIVRTAARISDSDPGTAALAALEQLVADDSEGQMIARQIAGAIGLADAATTPADSAWAVRRLFELVAQDRPLVVVVEDVHWAQPVLLDLLEHVADWSRGAPILLCCTARPDLLEARPNWGGNTNATTIPLEPLAEDDCSTLCDELLGDAEITDEQRRRVLDLAEGNPLFVEQMLAMLQTGGVEAADIPPTIDALLAARLDQLPMDERDVVESASIEGRVFHRSAVATLLPERAPAGVDENLLHLIRQELIDAGVAQFAGERAFSFGHGLICDAAYRAAPKRRRATQHEQFATWLQDKAADRLGEFEDLLAHHLARAVTFARDLGVQDEHTAELAERAAHHCRRVADRALARRDSRAGADMLAQVAALLPADDPRVPMVFALHALAAAQFFDHSEAQSSADRAIQLCPPGINAPVRGFAETIREWLQYHADPSVDTTGFNQRTRALGEAAELAGDTDIAAWLWFLAANHTSLFLERPAEAMTDITRAGRLLPGIDSRWLDDEVDSLRVFCILWGPGRIPVLFAHTAPPPHASWARVTITLRFTSILYAQQGDEAAALRAIDEFSEVQEKVGKGREMLFVAEWSRAQVYSLLGKPADSIGPYRCALEGMLEQGQTGYASTLSGGLARSLSRSGDYQAALEEAERARTLTSPGDLASEIYWRAAKAHALAHLGELDVATPLVGEAVDLAMSTQVPSCRFETLMDAADVYRIAGAMPRARQLLTQALEESTAREADGLSAQAKTALTRLQGT
jgi:class 3 adenylate cyclase/tetratricopeptide (TPR) repeat protein